MSSLPLGRLLVETGVLSSAALDAVLEGQQGTGKRLGELLVERGLVRGEQLAQLLSNQLGVPWVRLAHVALEPSVLALVPREVAVAHHVIPVHVRVSDHAGPRLYVAADDPTDAAALAACARTARMPVRPMVAVADDLRDAMVRAYGAPPSATRARTSLVPAGTETAEVLDDADVVEMLAAPAPRVQPVVLALNAPEKFLDACRTAATPLGASVVDGSLVRAAELAQEHQPCAIVVTEDVYAFDRTGLERLALDGDATLVAWSEDADAAHLAPLISAAVAHAARAAYEPGKTVDGRYELLRELDSTVPRARWEVRHVRTARRALLEIGLGDRAAGVRTKQVALARVTHPGAPELRDAGTSEAGDPYLVLELVEGRSLEALLAARGRIPVADICAIGAQVADLLAAAHAAGIAHGDVKLACIVLARDAWGAERARLLAWERAAGADKRDGAATEEARANDVTTLAACLDELLGGEDVPSVAPVLAKARAGELDARELARALGAALPGGIARSSLLEPPATGAAVGSRRPSGGAEQRRFPRAPYRTPVRLEVPGFGKVDGRSEDISVGGLLVVARAEVEPGTKVNVRFSLPVDGRVVTEPGLVKWVRSAQKDDAAGLRALGVELTHVSPDTLAQVERYVRLIGDAPRA